MRETIENWQGTDADLLVTLNNKTIQAINGTGRIGLVGMSDVDMALASSLSATVESTIEALAVGTVEQQAQASLFKGFLYRFQTADLDFTNEQLRTQLQSILLTAGWSQAQIDTVLAFGYTLESLADQYLGRDAVQADVDQVRAEIAAEAAEQLRVDALNAVEVRATAALEAAKQSFRENGSVADITAAAETSWSS